MPTQEAATKDTSAALKPQQTAADESKASTNDKTQASSQPISPATEANKPLEERKFPPAMPTVKLNLSFKPMLDITQVNHYIKHVPPVYDHNNLFFDWNTTLYELNSHDRRILAQINS